MAKLLDGKIVSQKIKEELKKDVTTLKQANNIQPALSVILVGNDPASRIYVKNKTKTAEEIGILSKTIKLPAETKESELRKIITELNNNEKIHGILVQLPLPSSINEQNIIKQIDPGKDVDGFHPLNMGALATGHKNIIPCTPAGIMALLHHYEINIDGKHCVVVGRSNIVGKPISLLLLAEHGTVTICHSHTNNLAEITRQADILVAAVGQAKLIDADMIKPGSVIIDVGMNRANGKLCGDVDFSSCQKKAGAITPVPGGVGLMTVVMLMHNTVQAAKNQNKQI